MMDSKIYFLIACTCMLLQNTAVKAQQDGDLRLSNGVVVNEGRVEVYYKGEWGTVCDDRFGTNDARVVCRQLGFEGPKSVLSRAGYGQGTGKIWMDGLECIGNEKRLGDCRFNGWSINDCTHREDVGVECEGGVDTAGTNTGGQPLDIKLRLSCPPSSANGDGDCNVCYDKKGCPSSLDTSNGVKGIVEVNVNDTWYPVSGNKWNFAKAKVVCGQLGYPTSFPIPSLQTLWPSVGSHFCYRGLQCSEGVNYKLNLRSTALNDLQCVGAEVNINKCFFDRLFPITTLTTENVATVHCGYGTENSEHCFGEDLSKEVYRLRGGVVPHMGRVEVRKNGVWGTICDLGWDHIDASIVCRNLGFGTAKKIYTRSFFGRGINSVHYSDLRCRNKDQLLSQCPSTAESSLAAQVQLRCNSHTGDVGVECNVPTQTCSETQMSNITGSKNYTEVNGVLGFGRVCDGTLDINGLNVVCRESRVLFARSYSSVQLGSSYSGILYDGKITCNGDEASLADCTMQLSSVTSCSGGVVVVTCTSKLPDLVPNLRQFRTSLRNYYYIDAIPVYYLTCAIEEKCVASTSQNKAQNEFLSLLRFDSLTMNYGTANFEPKLDRSKWIWHDCHQHYHSYENFITYDVLNPSGVEVAEGHKASFCLEDSVCDPGAHRGYSCTRRQGISVNCGDLYARHLDCQWIDVSEVGSGTYLLRQTVNADRLTPETDYKNNEIECVIRIIGRYVQVGECTHSDH